MDVRHLASKNVVTVAPESSLADAAAIMREQGVGALVVTTEDKKPIGILTDRDIVVGVLADPVARRAELKVKDVLTRDPIVALENEDSRDVLNRMRRHGIRRMPVVDGRGVVTGVFALDDALRAIAEELESVALLLRAEGWREQRVRRRT